MKTLKMSLIIGSLILTGSFAAASLEVEDESMVDTDTTPVKILSILPQAGAVETKVMITGQGFAANNTIHFGEGVVVNVPVASAIAIGCTRDPRCIPGILQTLVFTVPNLLVPPCYYAHPRCLMPMHRTEPGDYNVAVENSSGVSNQVIFKVTRY